MKNYFRFLSFALFCASLFAAMACIFLSIYSMYLGDDETSFALIGLSFMGAMAVSTPLSVAYMALDQ